MKLLNKYLIELQDNVIPKTIQFGNDIFKLQIQGSDLYTQEIKPKDIKNILKQIQKNYNKYKNKVLKYTKGEHDPDDYNYHDVKGIRNIKGDVILIDIRGNKPHFEIYWNLLPIGILVNKKGKKIKIKNIGLEIQGRDIVIYYVIPVEYNY